ncbi:MAG TPA: hypothetical protein VN869_06350 [Steroidobacteraceae bacterium]|nr:hypothetical protein [Steroidobacteraceae bacterium]
MRFIFQVATLPALISIALIVPFRVWRDLIEVMLPPALSLIGIVWIQAPAWRVSVVSWRGETRASIAYRLAAAVALLSVFRLLLRRSVAFY